MASQYKSRATEKRMNWELPSPIASSSPIVTQWQHLWRRECRSTDTLTGAPLVTVIEAGEKTWTDTTLTVETKELGRTETTPINEHCAGEEVVTMKQVEEETLLVAENGTQKGAESETGSVTFVGNVVRTITGSGTNSAPRMEAATHTETGARRLAIPTSSNMDFQPTGPRYSKSPETANRKRPSAKAFSDYCFPNHKQSHRNTAHFLNILKERYLVTKQKSPRAIPSSLSKTRIVTINGKYSQTCKGVFNVIYIGETECILADHCLEDLCSITRRNNLGDVSLHVKQAGTIKERCISLIPMKVLDAPGLKDDYYLNLVDWNAANFVAIGLSNVVYLWHPETGAQEAITVESEYISSLAWIKDRNNLAIGTSAAQVQLWDVETKKKLRNMQSHCSMVGALSWNDYILTSGSRFGSIHHHDVRMAQHHVGTLIGHDSQVCSLKWSPDSAFLASGGNDGLLNIWRNDPGGNVNSKPDMTINNLESAVKAMNWCPWQSRILAVGGGMKDGRLRIWDTKSGSCIQDVDTRSQICSLLWLPKFKELVTGHGFPKHQVSVWNYPTLIKSADLIGHRGRVLHLALSPDGNVVFSAAADETVCLWNCMTTSDQTKESSREGTRTL
ncbi:cell division cycle protein 20 homolog B [Amblyraja radiata]|uniref:cell division cycle protein 20 homolog B n=1 Tax=Amblyraja radiata TaxID=386614 RepID=UPI001403E294|nr:cell division cycle protein 20 homolog B [Amblyraja radiata]